MLLEVTFWESAMHFTYIYSFAMRRSVANNSNVIMVDNMNPFERFNAKVHWEAHQSHTDIVIWDVFFHQMTTKYDQHGSKNKEV